MSRIARRRPSIRRGDAGAIILNAPRRGATPDPQCGWGNLPASSRDTAGMARRRFGLPARLRGAPGAVESFGFPATPVSGGTN